MRTDVIPRPSQLALVVLVSTAACAASPPAPVPARGGLCVAAPAAPSVSAGEAARDASMIPAPGKGAASWLKAHPRLASKLYVAHAGDDDRNDAIAGFAAALRTNAPRGLAWSFEPRSDLTHATIYESVAPSLVRRLWPPLPAR